MVLVKSLIDDSPYELPFDVQLNEHMKRCRFHRSYNLDNYIHNLILSMCLMVQNVGCYDICDVWYKEIPSHGFKFIFFDRKNNAKVRNIFRSFNGAPRALSQNEFDEVSKCKGCDTNGFRWSLKEYLVRDKKIIEMKSSSKWISQYPVEKLENDSTFVQNEFSESMEKLFRIDSNLVPSKVKDKSARTHDLVSQLFVYYRDMSRFEYDTWNECGFHHGTQLAFQSVTNVTPEVFHIVTNSTDILYMRYESHVLRTNSLPVIFSICNNRATLEEQWEYGKNLCTRSGCYGKAVAIASHTAIGSGGVFHQVIPILASVDWVLFGNIDNWLANELNRIVPVNVAVPDENVQSPWTANYLSRYIVGLICSIERNELKCSYKQMKFKNCRSTQLLLHSDGVDVLMEINEYVNLSNKAFAANDNHSKFRLVKINQYIDSDRVARREILFIPPEADIQGHDGSDFTEITAQLDWEGIRCHIYDENFDKIVCDSISGCFDSLEALLGSRHELKAFIDGTFHYYETLHAGDGSNIQRTVVTMDKQKSPKQLVTFNFLRDWEQPVQLIDSVDALDAVTFKIVNIFYEKPYRVCVEDSALFHIDFDCPEKC